MNPSNPNIDDLAMTRIEVSRLREIDTLLGSMSMDLDAPDNDMRAVFQGLIDLAMFASHIAMLIAARQHRLADYCSDLDAQRLQHEIAGLAYAFSDATIMLSSLHVKLSQAEYIAAHR